MHVIWQAIRAWCDRNVSSFCSPLAGLAIFKWLFQLELGGTHALLLNPSCYNHTLASYSSAVPLDLWFWKCLIFSLSIPLCWNGKTCSWFIAYHSACQIWESSSWYQMLCSRIYLIYTFSFCFGLIIDMFNRPSCWCWIETFETWGHVIYAQITRLEEGNLPSETGFLAEIEIKNEWNDVRNCKAEGWFWSQKAGDGIQLLV